MASVLKIITDLRCQLYCDCELIGDVYPDDIFKMPLRKGAYIIEFKIGDIILYSTQYDIPSNDEECILKVDLADIYSRKSGEIKRHNIEKLNVSWVYTGKNWRIVSTDDIVIDNETGSTFIDLPDNYNLLTFDPLKNDNIDQCGYIPFNLCGTMDLASNCITGGKWGCINKVGDVVIQPIYGRKVFFENDTVTQVYAEHCIRLEPINRFGEQAFADDYKKVYPINEKAGLYEVTIKDKRGVVNKDGLLITPLMYSNFIYSSENKFWAKETSSGLWGLIDADAKVIQPFVYNDVQKAIDGFFVKMNNMWGVILKDGSIKFPPKYEVVADYCVTTYISSENYNDDYDFIHNYFSIVKVDGKYGIVNTGFEKYDTFTRSIDIKEIIPCKYDSIYSINGIQYTDSILKNLVSPRIGMPDGIFSIAESIFVVTHPLHLECDRYDNDENLIDTFCCSEFNEIYKIESDKYYLRNNNLFYGKIPFDIITTIEFNDGSWDFKPIYGEDEDSPSEWGKELLKRIYVVARKGDVCYVFGEDRSSILFKYRCDSILEFGITVDDNYFAIIEIGNFKRLVIADYNGKIEYESDNFKNIYSSYRLLSESASPDVMFKDECSLNGVSNDYFIMQLESGKWKVLVYREWNQKDYQSANYDSIRFIDEYRVEIHKYENGQKLYNGIYTGCWDDMSPVCQQWSNTPLVADK